MKLTTGVTALIATGILALAACGSDAGGPDELSAESPEALVPPMGDECSENQTGGTITMGEHVMLPSFAPGQGHFGVRGAAQSAAVYDRLMRWDPYEEEFVPQLAESLEANADNSVWTLGLREGVNFSNGDPLTAEDVAYTLGLHQDPETESVAMTDALNVDTVETIDPLTIEFTLTEPWSGFPTLLTGSAGEVIPRNAHEAADPEDWSRNPVGAGAFVMDEYVPDQRVVLQPNPEYWGGPVCPTLEFTQVPGAQSTLEAFQAGELQVAYLRGAKFATAAREAGEQGFREVISSGSAIFMNNGTAGYDGILTDQRTREAVAHALDRELIDQRRTDGAGLPTSALLDEDSRFYDGQEGPSYDEARASELVAELKEDHDWNGELELLTGDGPENVEAGVVTKALLDAVGFDVTITNTAVSQVTARQFTGDYELVISGLSVSDADPASTFASVMTPGGAANLTGVDDPELTRAITDVRDAGDHAARVDAYKRLQEVYNDVLPLTILASAEEYVTIDESVRGVKPTIASTMLFDDAYIEQ